MKLARDMWKNERHKGQDLHLGPCGAPSLPAGRAPPVWEHLAQASRLGPMGIPGAETCDTKLDLLRVPAWPAAATAVDASILCPQGTDDQGTIRLRLVPE